ncbi:Crp/Fnr family transcriptional regulator [Corallincola spongiicola]|uniref:Crp/Fnr family transcriptional regulator n=1 Tax=Corallincola spongiicola TaxID=2520508 RepID=A0ABY1WUB5_9GAMM|nr:Crp/Fnr family transcriptional regulator [Corallincola spongiicola]
MYCEGSVLATGEIGAIEWPCELTQALKDALISIAQPTNQIGEASTHGGIWTVKGVVYVVSGTVKLCLMSQDASNLMGALMGPHDWVGAASVDNDTNFSVYVEEVEPVQLLYFPANLVQKLCIEKPECYKWLFHCISRMQPKWFQAKLTSLHDKKLRVVYALMSLASMSPKMAGVLPKIRISQQQLSDVCGVSRPRVNGVLKSLEGEGSIQVSRGAVQILDTAKLGHQLDDLNLTFHDPRAVVTR